MIIIYIYYNQDISFKNLYALFQVDPAPFLKMCISDLSVVHERNFDETICESAAAYFLQCKVDGVQLKLPNYCGKLKFISQNNL